MLWWTKLLQLCRSKAPQAVPDWPRWLAPDRKEAGLMLKVFKPQDFAPSP